MVLLGVLGLGAALRFPDHDPSDVWFWVNAVVLGARVAVFSLAWVKPSIFEKR